MASNRPSKDRKRQLILDYIDAIRYHGATAQANARIDLLRCVYDEADGNFEVRKILLRSIERALSNEFAKDLESVA